eukprot:1894290-Prymnesium_polylepis.1
MPTSWPVASQVGCGRAPGRRWTERGFGAYPCPSRSRRSPRCESSVLRCSRAGCSARGRLSM